MDFAGLSHNGGIVVRPSVFDSDNPTHPIRAANLAAHAHSVTAARAHRRNLQLTRPSLQRLDLIQDLGGKDETVASWEAEGSNAGQRRNRRTADSHIGHSGCVNALCWSESGQLLASGSDDTRVILWKLGSSHLHPVATQPHMPSSRPWIGRPSTSRRTASEKTKQEELSFPSLDIGMASVIQTGHTANIFSVAFAPHSSDSRIITAAGDSQIRIFDVARANGLGSMRSGDVPSFTSGGQRVSVGPKYYHRYDQMSGGMTCRVLRCHRRRAKRLATENSPDIFLSVAEDGDVRSHDLRTHHQCRTNCPRPLLHSGTPLYSLSVSPLQPYLFAVAGISRYSYLYDRRMIGRTLEQEWGQPVLAGEEALLTKCVRRFGLPEGHWNGPDCRLQGGAGTRPCEDTPESMANLTPAARRRRLRMFYMPTDEHITAVKLGERSAGDLVATYSGGAVYFFNINDEPGILQHRTRSVDLADGATTSSRCAADSTSSKGGRKRDSSSSEQSPTNQPQHKAARPAPQDTSAAAFHASSSEATVDEMAQSPTAEELEGYPRYEQLLADGQADDLEGSSSGETSTEDDDEATDEAARHPDERTSEWTTSSSDEESDAESDEQSDEELDYDPLPISESAEEEAGPGPPADPTLSSVPLVYPRNRYSGHLNIETVKEVNFLGPNDEFVVSGSDDGLFFVWDKVTAELLGIWEGDGSVVNVVVPHPNLPLLAVSGIDDSVKIFGPADTQGVTAAASLNKNGAQRASQDVPAGASGSAQERRDPRRFSRWDQRRRIVRRNERRTVRANEAADVDEGSSDEEERTVESSVDDDDDDDDDMGLGMMGRGGIGGGSVSERFLTAALRSAMHAGNTGAGDDDPEGAGAAPTLGGVRLFRQEDGNLILARAPTDRGGDDMVEDAGEECGVM